MSSMSNCSALAPSRPAIFWLMPSILRGLAPAAALVSPVAMATMAADVVSATNRMPSGPKASGPIDLKAGLPSLKSAVKSAARASRAAIPIARSVENRRWERGFMAISFGWDAGSPRRVLGSVRFRALTWLEESCRSGRVLPSHESERRTPMRIGVRRSDRIHGPDARPKMEVEAAHGPQQADRHGVRRQAQRDSALADWHEAPRAFD